MARYRFIPMLAILALGTALPANARDGGGFLEASENPLLGTWLLSQQGINPNMPIRCGNLRLTFAHQAWLYNQIAPNKIATGPKIYTFIDHDHILIDEIPKCWYQRGPANGTTPLIDQINAEVAEAAAAARRSRQLPHVQSYEQALRAIDEAAAGRAPADPRDGMTYDQAKEMIDAMGNDEPAQTPAIAGNSGMQQSMDQLKRAVQDLEAQARQKQAR